MLYLATAITVSSALYGGLIALAIIAVGYAFVHFGLPIPMPVIALLAALIFIMVLLGVIQVG